MHRRLSMKTVNKISADSKILRMIIWKLEYDNKWKKLTGSSIVT